VAGCRRFPDEIWQEGSAVYVCVYLFSPPVYREVCAADIELLHIRQGSGQQAGHSHLRQWVGTTKEIPHTFFADLLRSTQHDERAGKCSKYYLPTMLILLIA